MIEIKKVDDKREISEITRTIMHSLPKWFSPPEDIEKKAIIHQDQPFFSATQGKLVVGFISIQFFSDQAADIYNLGVLEEYHRLGIGNALLLSAEKYLISKGCTYLTVKTLDSSADYEPYERTRSFYKKSGFVPLEIFRTYWDADNPCLFLAKKLDLPLDETYRRLVRSFWESISAAQFDRLREVVSPFAKIFLPNTREIFENLDAYIVLNKEYPGRWIATVQEIDICSTIAISTVRISDESQTQSFYVVSRFVFEKQMIVEITEYWGENSEPPSWRLEKNISKRY